MAQQTFSNVCSTLRCNVSRPKEIEENIGQHIPGCPPEPIDIINGILAAYEKRLLK
jgi:Ni,Fe-hydrogenase III small subunit